MTKDLDLNELFEPQFYDERVKIDCWLKSWEWKKIESQLEKGEKFDVLNETFENYPKGWLQEKEELESNVKALEEEKENIENANEMWKERAKGFTDLANEKADLMIENQQLKEAIEKIVNICDNIDFDDLIERIADMAPELKKHDTMPVICYKFKELNVILESLEGKHD